MGPNQAIERSIQLSKKGKKKAFLETFFKNNRTRKVADKDRYKKKDILRMPSTNKSFPNTQNRP